MIWIKKCLWFWFVNLSKCGFCTDVCNAPRTIKRMTTLLRLFRFICMRLHAVILIERLCFCQIHSFFLYNSCDSSLSYSISPFLSVSMQVLLVGKLNHVRSVSLSTALLYQHIQFAVVLTQFLFSTSFMTFLMYIIYYTIRQKFEHDTKFSANDFNYLFKIYCIFS